MSQVLQCIKRHKPEMSVRTLIAHYASVHKLFRFQKQGNRGAGKKRRPKRYVYERKKGFQKEEGSLERKSWLEGRSWKSGDLLTPEGWRSGTCVEINVG